MIHAGELVGELQLHDGRTRPYSNLEPSNNATEVYTGAYTDVYERLYHLPGGFHQADSLGICGSFRYDYQDGPPQLLGDIPCAPHVLDYDDQTHCELIVQFFWNQFEKLI